MSITHSKVSTAPPPADPDLVSGDDWNDPHVIALVDGDIPASIARDTEVTSAVAAEVTARDSAIGVAVAALSTVYQPLDSDLTAIAALSTTAYGRAFLALADAAAARTALALGTAATHATGDYDAAGAAAAAQAASQPLDSDLTAIAALSTTAFGRSFLALADAAAGRTLLGLGTAAVAATGDFDASGAAASAQAASQPLDSDLTAIAALSTTAYGRSVLALADAAALRTLAGSVIGTDVEAHDTDLSTIAGLTPTNDDVLQRKAGAWTNRTIAQLLSDLGIAAAYQPLDSDLTAIAALATTSFGRGLLILADAAALRTAAGLGTLATQSGTFSGTSSGTNTGDQSLPTRASLGVDTTDSPQFAGLNVGAATDTTITRVSAGVIAVEGSTVLVSGGALGTPASGVATNLTGTAAGLTAGTVTTNANLTGDVTSAGNATTIGAGKVTEAMQVLADNTTGNVATTRHGYAPKAPNDATKYLDGTGAYSVPAAAAGVVQVAQATIGTDFTLTGSTSDTAVTGLTTTMTTGAHRCIVIASIPVLFTGNGNNQITRFALYLDGSAAGNYLAVIGNEVANNFSPYDTVGFSFLTSVLSAASHTFAVYMNNNGAGISTKVFGGSIGVSANLVVIETSIAV